MDSINNESILVLSFKYFDSEVRRKYDGYVTMKNVSSKSHHSLSILYATVFIPIILASALIQLPTTQNDGSAFYVTSLILTIVCVITEIFSILNILCDYISILQMDWRQFLNKLTIYSITILHCLQFFRRIFGGACSSDNFWPIQIDCNPYLDTNIFPCDSALWLMSLPTLIIMLETQISIELVIGIWMIICCTLVAVVIYMNSLLGINMLILYFPISILAMSYLFALKMHSFLWWDRVQHIESKPSNSASASVAASSSRYVKFEPTTISLAQEHHSSHHASPPPPDIEFRHMMANVAHDLKTVSFFTIYTLLLCNFYFFYF